MLTLKEIVESDSISDLINEAWQIRILELCQLVTGNKDLEIGKWREALVAIETVAFHDNRLGDESYRNLKSIADHLDVDSDMSIRDMISKCLDVVRSRVEPKVGQRWRVLSSTCVIVDIDGLKAVNIDTGEFWDCEYETFCEHGEKLED